LADWAEDAAFSVIIIDFLDYLAAMRTMKGHELLVAFAQTLGVNLTTEQKQTLENVSQAIQDHIAEQPQRAFLILENMDIAALQDLPSVMSVLLLLIRLRRHFGRHDRKKFTAIVVFGGEVWSAQDSSRFLATAAEMHTPCFSKDQLSYLAEKVDVSPPPDATLETIMNHCWGHPYLSHLFVEDLRQGKSIDDIVRSFVSLQGEYGAHAERIVRRVRSVANNPDLCNARGGINFSELCRELSGHSASKRNLLLIDNWLKHFGVLDVSGRPRELYRLAFEAQLKSEEGLA